MTRAASTIERVAGWRCRRTYDASHFDLERLTAAKQDSVAVVLPARGVGSTIGPILDALVPLHESGFIDELLVVMDREDPALGAARTRGVEVLDESLPAHGAGPGRGKGDAIWRGLAATSSDIVVLMDTDTQNFGAHFLFGLAGPLLTDEDVEFVKGTFHRPLKLGGVELEGEGGRVTELVARPLLNLFFPELAGFGQPLAGELAARRDLLESFSMPVGFGVEIAMLIDALGAVGLDALAQTDLGVREDDNQTLKRLVPMAHSVLAAVMNRVPATMGPIRPSLVVPVGNDLHSTEVALEERPPLARGLAS